MPDTYTPYLGLCQPEVGGSIDTWGNKLNQDWTLIDQAAEKADAKISEAINRADKGVNDAAAAQATANTAVQKADAAQSTADTGVSKADTAQRRADQAYDAATAGGGSAAAAMEAAKKAQATADAAQGTANTANSTANTALNTANAKVNKSGDTMTGSLTVQGQIVATQNVVGYASDERLKTDIKPIEGFEERVMALNPVSFGWNEAGQKLVNRDEEHRENGFIAQDVAKVIPQAVMQNPSMTLPDSNEHPLTVKKDEMVADLVAQVQSLTKRVRALENAK